MPAATRSSKRSKTAPRRKSRGTSPKRTRATRSGYVRHRKLLLAGALVRVAVGIVALPLAPFLYREHFMWLVAMRPTKEVLLAGGFFARQGKAELIQILIAAVPLAIFGVWHAFALGRAYAKEIDEGSVPGIGGRLLPAEKIDRLRNALKRGGPRLIVAGRLAVFPSTLVASAAGASKMRTRPFLVADGVGGLLSIVEVVGAGYALGAAYKSGKPWLTVAGLAALIAVGVVLGRALRREPKRR